MTTKADFSPEEWKVLMDVPPAVGTAVMHAGKSGLGTVKESLAMVHGIMRADTEYPGNELVASLVAARTQHGEKSDIETLNSPFVGRTAEEILDDTLDRCREVAALLSSKVAADEAQGYVHWTLSIAEKVAHAAKEGGVLGIGGERVSSEEKRALAAIQAALEFE